MIASDKEAVESLLQAGIAAIKRRNLSAGQKLLLKAVEKDDSQALAWLWLSVAVEAEADKEVALENVLTLDPGNPAALKRLSRLKRRQAQPPASVAVSAPAPAPTVPAAPISATAYLAGTPADLDDRLDDPFQCAFCGRLTAEADKVCAHCGRSLHVRAPRAEMSEFLRSALFLLSLAAALGALEMAVPVLAQIALQPQSRGFFEMLLKIPGLVLLAGDFMQPRWTPALAQTLLVGLGVRCGVLACLLLGLFQRWRAVYYPAFGVLIIDLGWSVFALSQGYLGVVLCLLSGLLSLGTLVLLGGADREFAVVWERRWTRPDPQAHSAADFYRRGVAYSQAGLWALAVAQWRKAVGLAPQNAHYYKDLGIGLAQIEHFDRGLRMLAEAQRQAPDDAQIPQIIAVVREHLAKNGPPTGPA